MRKSVFVMADLVMEERGMASVTAACCGTIPLHSAVIGVVIKTLYDKQSMQTIDVLCEKTV